MSQQSGPIVLISPFMTDIQCQEVTFGKWRAGSNAAIKGCEEIRKSKRYQSGLKGRISTYFDGFQIPRRGRHSQRASLLVLSLVSGKYAQGNMRKLLFAGHLTLGNGLTLFGPNY